MSKLWETIIKIARLVIYGRDHLDLWDKTHTPDPKQRNRKIR